MLHIALLATLLQTQVPAARLDPAFQHPADLDLTRPMAAIRLSDQSVFLLDGGETALHLAPNGALLKRIMRAGDGPGELRSAFGAGILPDTIWIADGVLRRITYYSPALKLLGTQRDTDRCTGTFWALTPTGRCLTLDQPLLSPAQPDPPSLPLLLTSAHGRTDTVGHWQNSFTRIRYADAEQWMPQPFADGPAPTYSGNGKYLVWIGRKAEGGESAPQARIEWRDLASGATRAFLVPFEPWPLTPDSAAKYLTSATKGRERLPGVNDSMRARLYRPRLLPAFMRGFVDNSGQVWLQHRSASQETVWEVRTPSGALSLRFRLPAAIAPLLVDSTRILGVLRDEDDLPTLVQYLLPASR